MEAVCASGVVSRKGQSRWQVLRRPDAQVDFGVALPLGGTTFLAVLTLWLVLTPWQPTAIEPGVLIAVAMVLAALHETLHLLAWPRYAPRRLCFQRTGWRFSMRARFAGSVSRRRLLWVLAMPLLALSVLPAGISALTGFEWNFVVLLALLNALVSSGDVLAALLVLAQVPRDAVLREDGDDVLWTTSNTVGSAPPLLPAGR